MVDINSNFTVDGSDCSVRNTLPEWGGNVASPTGTATVLFETMNGLCAEHPLARRARRGSIRNQAF
jgi:hypothetical protein